MRYSEFYHQNSGKTVRVEMLDGGMLTGELFAYLSALDNEPNPESIVVDDIELPTNEIKSISVV